MWKNVHISVPLLSPALHSIIPKLATCQYFIHDKYVSLASFTGNSFSKWCYSQTFNSQTHRLETRRLATRKLADSQLAHYPDSFSYCWFRHSSFSSHMYAFEPGHEKMCLKSYANNKGADQFAHPRSLISAFVVCCLDSIIYLDSIDSS